MRQITKDVKRLKDQDLVNILLYCLYELTKNEEYSAISELAYVLDLESLFKLCSVYGGVTMTIPHISELKNISKALLIIESMQKGLTFEEAFEESDVSPRDKNEIIRIYGKLAEIIENYE